MKKILFTVLAVAAFVFSACSNFEASNNGNLDGFWQLTTVDTLTTGRSADVSHYMIFWSVQGGLIELSDRREPGEMVEINPSIIFRFERKDNMLTLLGEPKPRLSNRVSGDREVADRMQCGYYGLSNEGDSLNILQLEEQKMVLQSQFFRMYFRKY